MLTLFTERLRSKRILKLQFFVVFILLSLFFSCKKRKHSLYRNLSGKTFELVDYKAKLYYEGDSSESISGGIEKLTFAFEAGGFITTTVKLKDSTHIKKKTALRTWVVYLSNIDLSDASTYSQEFSFYTYYIDDTDYEAKELHQAFYSGRNTFRLLEPITKKSKQLILIHTVPQNDQDLKYPVVDSVIETFTFNEI